MVLVRIVSVAILFMFNFVTHSLMFVGFVEIVSKRVYFPFFLRCASGCR